MEGSFTAQRAVVFGSAGQSESLADLSSGLVLVSGRFSPELHPCGDQLYINNDELQDPRARAQGGNDSATKHSHSLCNFSCYRILSPMQEICRDVIVAIGVRKSARRMASASLTAVASRLQDKPSAAESRGVGAAASTAKRFAGSEPSARQTPSASESRGVGAVYFCPLHSLLCHLGFY
jgi:hypothetical protein